MLRTIFFEIFRIVEHNPEHYIQLNILGENVNACSRCLGAYIVGLVHRDSNVCGDEAWENTS